MLGGLFSLSLAWGGRGWGRLDSRNHTLTFLGVTVMPESASLVASMASLCRSSADGLSALSNDSTKISTCLAFDWNRRGRGPTRTLLREVEGLYGLSA